MINYELAKKLKDAGFPGIYEEYDTDDTTLLGLKEPTLSELIEACGDRFSALLQVNRDDAKWVAQADGDSRSSEYGSTPEEAVARLYLKLCQKDNTKE